MGGRVLNQESFISDEEGELTTGSCCCPLGAVIDGTPCSSNSINFGSLAAEKLGMPHDWAWGFLSGVDAYDLIVDTPHSREGYEAGAQIRKEVQAKAEEVLNAD